MLRQRRSRIIFFLVIGGLFVVVSWWFGVVEERETVWVCACARACVSPAGGERAGLSEMVWIEKMRWLSGRGFR